ncbi:hypothetical protein [Thalassotalea litorea]|uniref:hypothetical protein n=1 Tax=Thalassotalea litorea TaxID=2020715 RepID=UPI0037352E36
MGFHSKQCVLGADDISVLGADDISVLEATFFVAFPEYRLRYVLLLLAHQSRSALALDTV